MHFRCMPHPSPFSQLLEVTMQNYPQFQKVHDPNILTAYIAERNLGKSEACDFLSQVGTLCAMYVIWKMYGSVNRECSQQNGITWIMFAWQMGWARIENLPRKKGERNLSYEYFSKIFFAYTNSLTAKEREAILRNVNKGKPGYTAKGKPNWTFDISSSETTNEYEYGLTDT